MWNETLEVARNNWVIIAGVGTAAAAVASAASPSLRSIFTKAVGVHDMGRNTDCLKRQSEQYQGVTKVMAEHGEIKSVLIGNAENVNIFVRDDKNPSQIGNATFFLNEKSQFLSFYQAMGSLDNPKQILEYGLHPVEENQISKEIQKLAKKAATGWTNNPMKQFVSEYVNIPDKKQELSDNILGAFETLAKGTTEEILIPSRSALALKYKDEDGGVHIIAIPPNDLISKVLYDISKGKQKLEGGVITPRNVMIAVRDAHVYWCEENAENPEIHKHLEQ